MENVIRAIVEPVMQRVLNMFCRGVVQLVNDAGGLQIIQATYLEGEVHEAERLGHFGFSSSPPPGSEVFAAFIGGNRDHPIIIGVEHQASRIKSLKAGESCVYTSGDNFIHLKTDPAGNIIVSALSGNVRIEGKHVEIHGTDSLKVDCGGNGYYSTPTATVSYTTGIASSTAPIHPPEILPIQPE
jgi:phage baseplate assembly protein V